MAVLWIHFETLFYFSWMIVSSMVQLKLSWWQAWICVWLGYGIVAPFIIMNARPGAKFHVTFPVVARTSFGLYGSLWCTFNRGVMAWWAIFYDFLSRSSENLVFSLDSVWYGVQASIGGDCVKVMLRAMWPSVNNIRGFCLIDLGHWSNDSHELSLKLSFQCYS